ncbi:MAG: hypothetical protein P1V20_03435 [Verrucomicrobiales bacterium]|nr:hypothetical protein [Verrucomicrobiales bacterium]
MNPNQFTLKLQEAFQAARSLATAKDNSEFQSAHLLSAMLSDQGGVNPARLFEDRSRPGCDLPAGG